ncbi:cell adhesion molecule Dscam1-like isoform X3 [Amblyomma americanum]
MHAPCCTTKICTQLNIIAASFFLFHAVSQSKEVPEIRPFSFSKNIPVGGKALVTCLITSGAQPVTFSWLKDGDSLSTVQGTRQKADPDYSVLLLEPVLPSHVGNYTCIAKNKFGFDSYTTVLEVESSPMWKKVSGDISVVMGKTLVMECLAAGFPHPSLTFRRTADKHGNPVDFRTADERLTVHRNGTVTIKEVSTKDAGAYTCEAENGIPPNIQHTVNVAVHVPARFEEKSAAVTTRRTEVTRMKCQATGDQPLSIAWSKGSVKLDKRTSARYEVFETLIPDGLLSELVIRDTDRSDGALYTCHTQNKYGKDDRKVKLIVQEVPGPPQDVRLKDVWSRSASVSWSPSYSGNSPISKYIVQYWRDHGTAHRLQELEVIGSTTWTMVRDLLPGTAYVLNLVAENVIGRGEPSRTVVFHTGEEEPEAPPVDILVEMKGPSTVYISWKAPPREHWNGHLLGYYIGYRPRDSESPFSYRRVEASPNNASHEYLLGGLQRGTEYGLVLRAYNSAGSGPASQEKTVRTMDGDVPEAPRLFVTAVTADSMTLRWVIRSSSDVTGFNIHYRQDGGTWLELPIVNTANNTYTLTNLHPGYVYQVYVTASNVLGRGDPSAILLIRTESTASGHESSAIENKLADDTVPIYMDMAVMIPAGAILLAVLVILFSTCICVRKMKSTPRPVPEIMRYDPATLNTGTMMSQRYVEMEKMSEQDVPFAAPYEGGTIRNGTEMRGTLKERQEMKTYVPKPQNPMKDRPLPHPEQSPLRVDETYYDSAQ